MGKSTLVRQFAETNELQLLEINFEKHVDSELVFKTLNMPRILRHLEGLLGQAISEKKSNQLLFFDEIQATPHLIAALRYFFEDYPEIAVIAAGSLLEFALGQGLISMPVGRIQYHYVGPVTFSEYLKAKKEDFFFNIIKTFDPRQPLAESTHQSLLELQREYLGVGGMPQSIQTFLAYGDLEQCETVLQSILITYRDDFNKYAKKMDVFRLQRVFSRIAGLLNKKVKYSSIDPDEQSRDTKRILELLTQAKLITPVYHSHANGIPLGAESNLSVYKLLFIDVGLVNRMLGLSRRDIEDLSDFQLVNEGPLAEQFIGQSLMSVFSKQGKEEPHLFYWLREGKSSNAEVDFVVSWGGRVFPVEVKSGKAGAMKSLIQFVGEKNSPLAVRFDLNPPSVQKVAHQVNSNSQKSDRKVEFSLVSLPLYAVDELPRILNLLKPGI